MLRNIIIGIGTTALLMSCKNDCEKTIPQDENKNIPIQLSNCSSQLQDLIKTDGSHFRGIKLGVDAGSLKEDEKDLDTTYNTSLYFTPDIGSDFWADIDYYYDDNNSIYKVRAEISPVGYSEDENNLLVDSLFHEIKDYFSSQYGEYLNTPELKYLWNDVNLESNSVSIFTLDYEFPEEEFTIVPNEDTGGNDTIVNSRTILLKMNLIQ